MFCVEVCFCLMHAVKYENLKKNMLKLGPNYSTIWILTKHSFYLSFLRHYVIHR